MTAKGRYEIGADGVPFLDKGFDPGDKFKDEEYKLSTGSTDIKKDGFAYLHEGEAVIPKDFNPFIEKKGTFYSNFKNGLLKPNTQNSQSQYNIDINVAGNLDRSSIPNLKKAIISVINQSDREKYRRNKKTGVYNN